MPYIPNTDQNREAMLKRIGVKSFDELIADIPAEIRLKAELKLPKALSEMEAVKEVKALAGQNHPASSQISFLGGGAYDHYIPAAIDHILLRSEFYTAYTPYQAEVSQGTLQAIWEFQSLVTALTGMDAANASMYDGATALAEAGVLACNHTKRKQLIVARTVNPVYRQVLKTYAGGAGIEVVEIGFKDGATDLEALKKAVGPNTAGVLIQHPNFFGHLEQMDEISALAHQAGALLAVSVDPISLGLLKTPGEYGADIVTGEGQPLGMPTNLGGPYLGLFAVKTNLLRLMPGRLVGLTTDAKGQEGAVLTLQTREQHIRREKATSNICSNEALCALAAGVYLATMGPQGLRQVASLCYHKAHYSATQIARLPGYGVVSEGAFFNEFAVSCPLPPARLNERLLEAGILGGYDLGQVHPALEGRLLFCVTEMNTREQIDHLVSTLRHI